MIVIWETYLQTFIKRYLSFIKKGYCGDLVKKFHKPT